MMKHSKITKKEAVFAGLFCLLTAIGILMICTKSSVLYPFNDWVDANCYFSMGKSMMNGKVLYRDIYDHKGPLLYSLHGFAYLISQDTFVGVFLFEIIACALFLLSVYFILRLYVGKIALPALPIIAAVLYSAYSFAHGDSAEEFCLPMMSWSLYAMLEYFQNGYPGRVGWKRLVLHGVLAGCIMWIKFTMLGFHFAWMVTVIIIYASRKEWKAIITDGLTFLGGMLLATVPFIIYFGVNGAIIDWLAGYIYNNVFVYTTDTQFQLFRTLKSILRNTLITFMENWQYSLFIVLGVLYFLFGDKKPILQKVGLGLLCVLTAMGIYWGSQAYYLYYGYIFTVFVVLGFVPILRLLERLLQNKGVSKDALKSMGLSLAWGACLAVGLVFCYMRSSNVYLLGYPQEDMVQFKFKEIIEETEDPTLLNYGFLDGGFYTVCNIVPTCKYFAKFNIPLEEIHRSQEDLIIYGQVDYVVTRNFELDEMYDKYELVAQDSFWFDVQVHDYYLYRLK